MPKNILEFDPIPIENEFSYISNSSQNASLEESSFLQIKNFLDNKYNKESSDNISEDFIIKLTDNNFYLTKDSYSEIVSEITSHTNLSLSIIDNYIDIFQYDQFNIIILYNYDN